MLQFGTLGIAANAHFANALVAAHAIVVHYLHRYRHFLHTDDMCVLMSIDEVVKPTSAQAGKQADALPHLNHLVRHLERK